MLFAFALNKKILEASIQNLIFVKEIILLWILSSAINTYHYAGNVIQTNIFVSNTSFSLQNKNQLNNATRRHF